METELKHYYGDLHTHIYKTKEKRGKACTQFTW